MLRLGRSFEEVCCRRKAYAVKPTSVNKKREHYLPFWRHSRNRLEYLELCRKGSQFNRNGLRAGWRWKVIVVVLSRNRASRRGNPAIKGVGERCAFCAAEPRSAALPSSSVPARAHLPDVGQATSYDKERVDSKWPLLLLAFV